MKLIDVTHWWNTLMRNLYGHWKLWWPVLAFQDLWYGEDVNGMALWQFWLSLVAKLQISNSTLDGKSGVALYLGCCSLFVCLFVGHCWSVGRSVCWSVGWSVGRSGGRSVGRLVGGFEDLRMGDLGGSWGYGRPYIALQQTRQDSLPQMKVGKTLNLRLFGVCFWQKSR